MPEGTEEKKTPSNVETLNSAPDPAPEPPKAKAAPAPVVPPEGKPESAKDDAKAIDAEGDIPTDANLLKLTPAALTKRLDRYSKKQLSEHFGTDDVEKIKSDLAELATARQEREEARRAALSKEEKLKEDLEREKKRAEKAEADHKRVLDAQAFSEYDRSAEVVLAKHVDPELVDVAVIKLKKHVLGLDDDELLEPEKVFEQWAKDWTKKNPKYARASEAPPPPKKPLTTGADPHRPEKAKVDLAQKTARPGQPNSMTRAEYAAYKRQHGLT